MEGATMVEDIPDVLNNHFCNIGPNLAETLGRPGIFNRQSNTGDGDHRFAQATAGEVAELM